MSQSRMSLPALRAPCSMAAAVTRAKLTRPPLPARAQAPGSAVRVRGAAGPVCGRRRQRHPVRAHVRPGAGVGQQRGAPAAGAAQRRRLRRRGQHRLPVRGLQCGGGRSRGAELRLDGSYAWGPFDWRSSHAERTLLLAVKPCTADDILLSGCIWHGIDGKGRVTIPHAIGLSTTPSSEAASILQIGYAMPARCLHRQRDWLQADVVFMSPPWGGPQYIHDELYDADTSLAGFGGLRGLMTTALGAIRAAEPSADATVLTSMRLGVDTTASAGSRAVVNTDAGLSAGSENRQVAGVSISNATPQRRGLAMFLPRQTDLQQLSAAVPEGRMVEVERAVLDGFVKGITVYLWLC